MCLVCQGGARLSQHFCLTQLRQLLCCLALGKPGCCSASRLPIWWLVSKEDVLQGAEIAKAGRAEQHLQQPLAEPGLQGGSASASSHTSAAEKAPKRTLGPWLPGACCGRAAAPATSLTDGVSVGSAPLPSSPLLACPSASQRGEGRWVLDQVGGSTNCRLGRREKELEKVRREPTGAPSPCQCLAAALWKLH